MKTLINLNGSVQSVVSDSVFDNIMSIGPVPHYVDGEPKNLSDYWHNGEWRSIGEPPDNYHTFDYAAKQWIDYRSIEEIRQNRRAKITADRDALEFGGFIYKGNVYDSDQVSQGRIMGAANAGADQTWTLADNTTVDLTAEDLKELYATLQEHVSNAHERGRTAKALLDAATTIEQIKAVTL